MAIKFGLRGVSDQPFTTTTIVVDEAEDSFEAVPFPHYSVATVEANIPTVVGLAPRQIPGE